MHLIKDSTVKKASVRGNWLVGGQKRAGAAATGDTVLQEVECRNVMFGRSRAGQKLTVAVSC